MTSTAASVASVSPPPVTRLAPETTSVLEYLNRIRAVPPSADANDEGGDVAHGGSHQLVVRHVANYQAAVEIAVSTGIPEGPILDVGCGTAALSAWTAEQLGRELHLSDHQQVVLATAERLFDIAGTTNDLAEAPVSALVLAMEVLEHVPPADQPGFVDALWSRVAPGGLLILSTPDESGYPGGWSGYAPHIGCVSPTQLESLLAAASGEIPWVGRLSGRSFTVTAARRRLERTVNVAWTAIQAKAPALAAKAASRGGGAADPLTSDDLTPWATPVDITPWQQGDGVGLLAVIRRPT